MPIGLTNTEERFGLVSIALHWGMAFLVYALFALGLYMTGLDYMDAMYRSAPSLHKSFGLLLFCLALFRLGWRTCALTPLPVPMPGWERRSALTVHWLFYALLLFLPVSGYLISTADGRGVQFFGLFSVPALLFGIDGQADAAGTAHLYLAFFIVALSGLHVAAALKHHFIDKDRTLVRIFGTGEEQGENNHKEGR